MEKFFIHLIRARKDDSVSELGSLEFTTGDFQVLRASLFSWLWENIDKIRKRLGSMIQLHTWFADDEEVKRGMAITIVLGRMASGMLSPPRGSFKSGESSGDLSYTTPTSGKLTRKGSNNK
jgi:hypothetical protein